MLSSALLVAAGLVVSTCAQNSSDIPNSFPHDYPGKPSGDFSPEWQDCTFLFLHLDYNDLIIHGSVYPDFLVKDSLPNVSFPLPRNFAGNIGVNRANHPNDTLFFWAFESQNGSLTAAADECSDRPWAIWLTGGYVLILVL